MTSRTNYVAWHIGNAETRIAWDHTHALEARILRKALETAVQIFMATSAAHDLTPHTEVAP